MLRRNERAFLRLAGPMVLACAVFGLLVDVVA
jgi:hypothetical protein